MTATPQPPSSAGLWLRASPRGTRSGFAVLPDGTGGMVTVTVLPKPWAVRGGGIHEVWHEPGATTHVVLHETEFVMLHSAGAALGEFAMGANSLASEQADLLAVSAQPTKPAVASQLPRSSFADLIDLMLLADRVRVGASRLAFEGDYAASVLRLLQQERLLARAMIRTCGWSAAR